MAEQSSDDAQAQAGAGGTPAPSTPEAVKESGEAATQASSNAQQDAPNGQEAGETATTASAGTTQHDEQAALRGRRQEIKEEDAQFAKRAISPSPTRSSLSAALHAHNAPTLSPVRGGSPAPGTPGSGANTPADLSTDEQIERLRSKVADLTSQVTSLNGKLVASYNRVGNLEDEADQKVMEIRDLTSKVDRLEAERKVWEDKYEGGLLVEKAHVQNELKQMMDRVIEETASRGKAENDKAHIEQELESLSQSLFQEANTMVAMERKERLRAERKMEQLERNFQDTEQMMTGQSAQMRELGSKIDELEHERDDLRKQVEELQHQLAAAVSSASSQSGNDDSEDEASGANGSNISIRSESVAGTPAVVPSSLPDLQGFLSSSITSQPSLYLPLSGNALAPGTPGASARGIMIVHPIQFLSFELPPFQEFVLWTKSMMRTRRVIMSRPIVDPNSTVNTAYSAYGGYPAPYAASSMNSGSSLPGYISEGERQAALKETLQLSQYLHTPFIKRIVEEDSDPTLHLDNAPGLSFFSRRQIATAIIDGDLAIEPAHTSLPSDKCSLCGTSLAKFIASHQVTQPKDDPRKKLTRLATGWIPSSISGTATPTKEAQDRNNSKDPWSISALTDALGALTPSREIAGFSFGSGPSEKEKASQGHYTVYNPQNSGSRPTSSSGRSMSSGHRASFGANSAAPPDRKASMPPLNRQASISGKSDADNGSGTKDGLQHDYVLTQSARQQGQIYLFRSLDSTTRYTLCPHYCLPRLRAVCELWTYVRSIHKGLLMEDNPKIYPSPFGTSNEYTKLFRRFTANVQSSQTQNANNVIQDIRTPAPGVSRQLGDGFHPHPPSGLSSSLTNNDKKDANLTDVPPILTTTNSLSGLAGDAPIGLGLDMENKKTAEPSEIGASSASSNAGDDESSAKPSEPSTAATSTENLPAGSQEDESVASDAKASSTASVESELASANASSAPALPSRPPRSAARSSPMTPSTSGDGAKFPTPSALSITALKGSGVTENDKTPTQSPDLKQGESPAQPINISSKVGSFAVPRSPKPPSSLGPGGASGAPPALPPRSPRFGGAGRAGPGRISLPTSGLSLSTSLNSEGGFSTASAGTTPGLASAGTAAANSAVGPISTMQADWQQKCWYEVIRLKEGVFWSRVGANYNKDA